MIGVASYLVDVDEPNHFADYYQLSDDIQVLPISGRIASPAMNHPGKTGDRIYFQWNALLEPVYVDGKLILDTEYVYRVGDGLLMNGWVWVEITEELDGLAKARIKAMPPAIVNDYEIDQPIMFERIRAHRIETQGVNTLNPHGMPLYALKYSDILALTDVI